jgi:hypothetical protein
MHVNERIKNSNGNTSEWVKMELHEIIGSLLAIVLQSNKNNIKGTVMISQSKGETSPKISPSSSTSDLSLPINKSTNSEFTPPILGELPSLSINKPANNGFTLPSAIGFPSQVSIVENKPSIIETINKCRTVYKLKSEDGTYIDLIEYVRSVVYLFTERTPGKQNVSKSCFREIMFEYTTNEKKYKLAKYIFKRNQYEVLQGMDFFWGSISDIMEHLGYNIENFSDKYDNPRERYVGLSWKNTVNWFENISNMVCLYDKYLDDNRSVWFELETKTGERIDQITFVRNMINVFTEKTPGQHNIRESRFGHAVYNYATRYEEYKISMYENSKLLYVCKDKWNVFECVIRNTMLYLGYILGDPVEYMGAKEDRYIGLSWSDASLQFKRNVGFGFVFNL